MRFRKFKFLAFTDSAEFFFFRCEILKHQNRGKTFLREGMKYFTPAFVKEKSSLCGTIWHLITRFVSYEGFTEILSRHFRSKGKMYPELRRSEGFIFIPFERKWRDKISVNPESLTYLVVKCHCATKNTH